MIANMQFHTEYPDVSRTKSHREYINITPQVGGGSGEELLHSGGDDPRFRDAYHLAGVYVNDAEDGLIRDIDEMAGRPRSVPGELQAPSYRRRRMAILI